jgi:hypothetical protein
MTPRQLMALCDAHREYEGHRNGQGGQSGGQSGGRTRAAVAPGHGQGSAGWLMAVSRDLNRSRSGRQRPVYTVPAPGVS